MVEKTNSIEQFELGANNEFADFGVQLDDPMDRSVITRTSDNRAASDALLATNFTITNDTSGQPSDRRKWQPPVHGEFATNESGDRLDPINFYFHGSIDEIKATFRKAGWTEAEDEVIHGVKDRDKWPMSDLYYPDPDGKLQSQVTGFSKGTSWDRGTRNHLRIFDTGKVDEDGRQVWAVAASRDAGFKLAPGRLLDFDVPVRHKIEHITDDERQYVRKSLEDARINADINELKLDFDQRAQGTSKDGIVYDIWLGGRPGPKFVGPDRRGQGPAFV